ncbi:hypothetical protein [Catellatospora chokoriensis]|nr:hypothetical protein [Catellatospora chokoriensis]
MESMILLFVVLACIVLVVAGIAVAVIAATRAGSRGQAQKRRPAGFHGPVHTSSGDPVWTDEHTWQHNVGSGGSSGDSGGGWSGGSADSGGGGWSGGGADSGGSSFGGGGGGSDSGSSSSSS